MSRMPLKPPVTVPSSFKISEALRVMKEKSASFIFSEKNG